VTAIQLIPTSPVAGQPFTARVTVTNTGEIASDPFIVGVYADKAATAACGEAADKTNTTGPIAVGASATVNFALTAGTVGNKILRAFSDLFCNLQEVRRSRAARGAGVAGAGGAGRAACCE
jgi:hypothetical protein